MARNWWQPPELRTGRDVEEERHATWLELFFDLIFVVAVAQVADVLLHNVTPSGFLEFVFLFVPVWWSWVGYTYYATRFDTDDLGHRLLTGVQMLFVAALAVNAPRALGATSVGFALSYAAIRSILVIEYIRAGKHVPRARKLTRRYSRGFGLAAAIWLVSVFMPPPWRFVLWMLGIVVDFGTPITAGTLHAELPPHTSHLPERFGLFTIIVLGEAVAAVVRGVSDQEWGSLSVTTAAFGLVAAFGLWWLYFESSGGGAIRAAVKAGRIWTYQGWIYAHLLLVVGIAAGGVGMELVILDAPRTALPDIVRWLVCGTMALCLLALAVIHSTTVCEKSRGRFRPETGALYRAIAAAFVLILAPAAANMLPVVLAAILAIVCAVLVVLDFYEQERHGGHE